MLQKLGLEEGEAIIHPWINKALEKAQTKVEARNFDIRKNLLKFDNVMNDQRKVIFEQRIELMRGDEIGETVADMREEVIADMVTEHIPEKAYAEQWDTAGLKEKVQDFLALDLPVDQWAAEEGIADEEIRERIQKAGDVRFARKVVDFSPDVMRQIEKAVLLQTLDHLWREHLVSLEHLRQVVGFRGYGQRDPLNEYKTEAFSLFEVLLHRLREAVTGQMMRVELVQEPPPRPEMSADMEAYHLDPATGEDEMVLAEAGAGGVGAMTAPPPAQAQPVRRATPEERDPNNPATWGKVGRNEKCPCGSGKKFKHCHGAYG